jgi:hypothetical protein
MCLSYMYICGLEVWYYLNTKTIISKYAKIIESLKYTLYHLLASPNSLTFELIIIIINYLIITE